MKKSLIKTVLIYLGISLIPYVLFYWRLLNKNTFIGGNDPLYYFYPTRFYLWESLKSFHFPFWTERTFAGFPIYADSERGFLNLLNIFSILVFGPLNSYKFLHILFYLCGSFAFISFLKRKGFSVLGIFCANVVYYFSFFHLYHQQHFNFILTTFMIPVGLLFVDSYLSTRKLRWWIYFTLLTSFLAYFGAFQALLIFMLPAFIYFFVYGHKCFSFREFLNLLLIYFLLVFSLVLPQILPSAQLYLNSSRGDKNVTFTEGSFNPIMLANSVYPYSFGVGPNYKWNLVSDEYFVHETYVYSGIIAVLLAFLGFVSLKDRKFKLFLFANILVYLVLGFIKYIPILGSISLPIISMFRYWGRTDVLFSLAVACLSGYFVSFPEKLKLQSFFKDRLLVYLTVAFSFFIIYSFFVYPEVRRTLALVFNSAVMRDTGFFVWVALAVIGTALCFLLNFSKSRKFVLIFLVFLVTSDLYYFGNRIVKDYLRSYDQIVPQNLIDKTVSFKNTRIVMLNPLSFWNKGLYFNHWSLFGYSQYVSARYESYLEGLGFPIKGTASETNLQNYKNIGVKDVLDQNGDSIVEFGGTLIGDFSGDVISSENEEGHFLYRINSFQPQTLNTYISNYPGWEVLVNGKKVSVPKDSVFLTFAVPEGALDININFIPKILYYSIALSFIFLALSFFLIKDFLMRYNQKL